MGRSHTLAPKRLLLLGRFEIEWKAFQEPRAKEANNGARSTLAKRPSHLPPRSKAQSLLAYLVLHPQPQTREALAALLWGDVPDLQARGSLRKALTLLRRQFGPELLLADREGVQLNPTYPLWVDALEFSGLAEHRHEISDWAPDAAIRDVQSAVDLYRGDLLADSYEDWVAPERERFRVIYLEALLALAQWMRTHGEYDRSIGFAERALASDAANEPAHQILMFSLLALGRRMAALKQFEDCRQSLRRELDVEPSPETMALYEQIKQAPGAGPSAETVLTNLPKPLTSFIGRERELAALGGLLERAHLLTLTGAGGCGKTRLALELARRRAGAFQDGVWWVEFAALTDPSLVPERVARVLGVSEVPGQPLGETMSAYLRPKQVLLVLDNCEHLVEACARLAETLLRRCPQVRVLATSRQALNIDGEQAWIVPSLSVPAAEVVSHASVTPAALMEHEGIRLFVERSQAVRPDLALTASNGLAVARICSSLDGIPLAIELAASRMHVLSAEQIASRVHDALALLTTGKRTALPRHRTLEATIDWSYALLSGPEQILFRRLAVFAGDFGLDAVESICAGDGLPARSILELLSGLVEKSLLLVQAAEEGARYRLLEMVRQYAQDKLRESGEEEEMRNRHRDYFLELAEEAETELHGPEQVPWLNRLEREHDNLRAALSCCMQSTGGAESGLRLASALWWFWFAHDHWNEGATRLAEALAKAEPLGATALRAKALVRAAFLHVFQEHIDVARELSELALAIARKHHAKQEMALALYVLAEQYVGRGEAVAKIAMRKASLELWREAGVPWGTALVLNSLGEMARTLGEYDAARAWYEESLAIRRAMGDTRGLAVCLGNLGAIAYFQGSPARTREYARESLLLYRQVGGRGVTTECLNLFAGAAELEGGIDSLRRAARLVGAIQAAFESIGNPMEPLERIHLEHILTQTREKLREEDFAKAYSEGHAMSLEQAIEYALAG